MEHVVVDKAPYDAWEQQGFITITDTPIVDQSAVMRYVIDTCAAHDWDIQCLCFDPANASKLMLDLSDDSYEIFKIAVKIADGQLPGELFPEKTQEETTLIYQEDAEDMLRILYGVVQ